MFPSSLIGHYTLKKSFSFSLISLFIIYLFMYTSVDLGIPILSNGLYLFLSFLYLPNCFDVEIIPGLTSENSFQVPTVSF